MQRNLPFIIIGAVLVLVIVGAGWWYKSQKQTFALITKDGAPGSQPAQVLGPTNARVTLEEFGDFQCQPCGVLHATLKRLESDYGSRVAIVFREFPLPQIHANALEAARAAEAAGLQGHFWQMHDFIYDTQHLWSDWKDVRPLFLKQARIVGLDPERLRRDMDSQVVQQRIAADQERGQSLGVVATPTLLLNGRQLTVEEMNEGQLRELIDMALRR